MLLIATLAATAFGQDPNAIAGATTAVAGQLTAQASEADDEVTNHFIFHAGGGIVTLDGGSLQGVNVGLGYRSMWGSFAFDAEPISITYDGQGSTTGLRVGFIAPGARAVLFPHQAVSPSIGGAVGFNYTTSTNADTGFVYSAVEFEARASLAVDFARDPRKVHPNLELMATFPILTTIEDPDVPQRPVAGMLRLGLVFPTQVSAIDLVRGWTGNL